ncbi:hypothetical protein C3K47_18890 [Solitalea longa]|uniref:Uncharacterized protein n=1 Tax=Solitalea longa TaxID=2079460 RepID=A0A2S4ZXQ7_9SPHI|nr:hypothetical protein [Solitalea longa]POY34702.1 hypothetical protein C3K47_18890 [Solitalea longa]
MVTLQMDIKLTFRQGGMWEFEKTGIYPEYLIFSSKSLNRSWRYKKQMHIQKGSLKVKDEIICNYIFDSNGCKIQEVKNGIPCRQWVAIDVFFELCD